MTLPHSDACFVSAYPAAIAEAWLDDNRAFAFFGGVPQSIDNDKRLVHIAGRPASGRRLFTAPVPLPFARKRLVEQRQDKGQGGRSGRLRAAELHGSCPPVQSCRPSMSTWRSNAANGKATACAPPRDYRRSGARSGEADGFAADAFLTNGQRVSSWLPGQELLECPSPTGTIWVRRTCMNRLRWRSIARHPRSYEREDLVFEHAALSGLAGAEDRRPRPGCPTGRLEAARTFAGLRRRRSPHGQGR